MAIWILEVDLHHLNLGGDPSSPHLHPLLLTYYLIYHHRVHPESCHTESSVTVK